MERRSWQPWWNSRWPRTIFKNCNETWTQWSSLSSKELDWWTKLNVSDILRAYIFQSSVSILVSFGDYLRQKQIGNVPERGNWDYEFIGYFHKALAFSTDPEKRSSILHLIKFSEAQRDYFPPSLRHINHLIQKDDKPNLELKEPQCEIYKISISFRAPSKS